jgi:accessory gene regulator B
MIRGLAKNIALLCAENGIYEESEVEVYSYGYELLISTLINAVIVMAIGIMLRCFAEAVLYMLVFASVRTVAGGFHARSHIRCIAAFSASFLFFAFAIKYVSQGLVVPYVMLTALISSITMFTSAPVAAPNKPMSEKKLHRLKKWCVFISGANLGIGTAVILIPKLQTSLAAAYYSGFFAVAVSLLIAGKLRKEDHKNV